MMYGITCRIVNGMLTKQIALSVVKCCWTCKSNVRQHSNHFEKRGDGLMALHLNARCVQNKEVELVALRNGQV